MAEAGIPVEEGWALESTFGIESGAESARHLMALNQPPTAVFAVNDNTAIGALSAFEDMGLSVPTKVSLVGYNDIPIVSRLSKPLTTVRVPFDQIATAALELLRDTPTNPNERLRAVTPTLIPRRTTAPLEPHGRGA
jgi:LacI family transcriptional regulator